MKILVLLCTLFCFLYGQDVYAQQKTIKGTVTDTQGEALIGVAVAVKGMSTGTITDLDGKYTLSVATGAKTLVASYIGMTSKEVAISGTVVDIVLEDNLSELDEVVVIGYGTLKKRDLTGSVASVQGNVLQAIPVANVSEALTGKLAGVQITATEGSPDAELKIRVRGGGSITGDNSPLIIVDGFPVESMSDISPSDIESVDVLKDASSTAIYGARGANGVIIITTKGGKAGKISVTYNTFYSVKKIAKKLDVLDVNDYLNWQYEYALLKNNNNPESYEKYFGSYQDMDMYDGVEGNNWQEQIYGRTGHVFNHNLGISGGSEKTVYAFNYAHVEDKAIMVGSDYKRDNLSLKLNHKPSSRVSIDYSVRYSSMKINGGGMNEQNEKSTADSRLKHTIIYTPIPMEVFDPSANDEEENASNLVRPDVAVADNNRKQDRKSLNMGGGLSWEVFDNFILRTDLGLDYYNADDNRFYGTTTYYVKNSPTTEDKGKPAVFLINTTRNVFRNTNTANYDFKKILKNKDHSLKLLLGEETLEIKQKVLTNVVHGFPVDFTSSQAFKLTTQGNAHSTDNYFAPDDKLLSFFGRANYDYQGKYLASATFRADGSSKFADGNRWGYFPSASVAWRMSSENFMSNTKEWLDDLKLRLSYGTAGNNNIPSGQMIQSFVSSPTTWIQGFNNYWSASKVMANPDLKWETTYTRNVGLDYTLLGSRLSGSVEFYLNNTKDLLINFPIAGTGYDSQYRNMGETENRGLEFQMNYVAVDNKNYGLSFNFNIGFNKNKIKSLGMMDDFGQSSEWASTEIGNDFMVAVGGSVGEMYGYRSDGRYEISDFEDYNSVGKWQLKEGVADASSIIGTLRPGMMKLKNIEGEDNKVNIDDRTIIGNANPTHTGGFSINGRAHGFDLSAAFNWSYGNDIYNANKIEYTSTSKYQYRNQITEMASGNRWTNLTADGKITNDATELAALNANTTMWSPYMSSFVFSDWAVEDGSFLRLNTLTLGYTLPKALLSKVKIQNLRFYTSVYNVFCLTDYSGFDPEVSTRRKTALTPGVDYSAYPKSRQFLFGMNLSF